MREIVGFAAGVTVTAAASVLLRSESGRRLVRELMEEAEPDLRVAAEEWRPLVREVARAMQLGVREVAGAIDALEGHLARLADEAAATRAAAGAETEQAAEPDAGAEPADDGPLTAPPGADGLEPTTAES